MTEKRASFSNGAEPIPLDDAPPTMLGKREQTKASNRQAILNAARKVFSDLGYGATSVRDIIRGTGLASGTFYNYFKSKEEVFEALMDERALRARPRLREERQRAKTLEEFVRITFRSFFEFCREDLGTYEMVRRNSGQMKIRMDTAEVIAGVDELKHDIKAAIDRGVIPPVDLDFLSSAFVGVAFELADRMVERETIDVDFATDFATALFMGGVAKLPGTEDR